MLFFLFFLQLVYSVDIPILAFNSTNIELLGVYPENENFAVLLQVQSDLYYSLEDDENPTSVTIDNPDNNSDVVFYVRPEIKKVSFMMGDGEFITDAKKVVNSKNIIVLQEKALTLMKASNPSEDPETIPFLKDMKPLFITPAGDIFILSLNITSSKFYAVNFSASSEDEKFISYPLSISTNDFNFTKITSFSVKAEEKAGKKTGETEIKIVYRITGIRKCIKIEKMECSPQEIQYIEYNSEYVYTRDGEDFTYQKVNSSTDVSKKGSRYPGIQSDTGHYTYDVEFTNFPNQFTKEGLLLFRKSKQSIPPTDTPNDSTPTSPPTIAPTTAKTVPPTATSTPTSAPDAPTSTPTSAPDAPTDLPTKTTPATSAPPKTDSPTPNNGTKTPNPPTDVATEPPTPGNSSSEPTTVEPTTISKTNTSSDMSNWTYFTISYIVLTGFSYIAWTYLRTETGRQQFISSCSRRCSLITGLFNGKKKSGPTTVSSSTSTKDFYAV